MSHDPQRIVQKLWNYCNILRDDGLSYGDYLEQLTFLLFLKMADEQSRPPFNKKSPIPPEYSWPEVLKRDGDELEIHYRHTLEELGKEPGLIGVIFRKAQNKIQDPAKLRRLIADLIDKEEWSSLDTDVKGDAYEGLLQKNAEDVKGGAGQYFTPRPLIRALVDVMQPQPNETICDPACGTGGFLLIAHDFVRNHNKLDKKQLTFLNTEQLRGVELVDSVARLCCMNLVLHGIGSDATHVPVMVKDALAGKHGEYEMVLTNPPFGKKSSVTIVNEAGDEEKQSLVVHRDDFWAGTSNKQLNFLQRVFTILKQHGRAAIDGPDNVLCEGGAGETVRRRLLAQGTYIPCFACLRGSSMPRVSRRTFSSSTASRRANIHGRNTCGFTICALTSGSRSKRIRSIVRIWMSSLPTTTQPTDMSGQCRSDSNDSR